MIIVLVLCILSIFDVTTPTDYTCDRRATCGCSKRSIVISAKILGGKPVDISHSWGWIASLRGNGMHRCGASLLTPSYAITAAHCVQDIILSELSLHFGIINLSDTGEIRNVMEIFTHPSYKEQLHTNDLAILRLHKPINLTNSNISSICLPDISDFNLNLADYPPVGEDLIAIGWGITTPFASLPSPILRQVTLQAMARTDKSCVTIIYDNARQFCAGFSQGGKDTCQGDSGGPLMLFKNGRWQLVGITSYGGICGSSSTAGVYTDVAYYNSFIQEIINSNDRSIPNTKQADADSNELRSNTETLYQKSKVELLFIFLFIFYRKVYVKK